MGRAEQAEEREVLDSIFPDEITDVSATEYRIEVKLDLPVVDTEDDDEPPTLILKVAYPEDYPDVAPDLDISAAPHAPRHPDLDVTEDKARLLESVNAMIEENLGMAMIFTLYSTLKDSAELLIAERRQAAQALADIEAQKREAEDNKKFMGTPVNRETFLEWRERFRKDMEELARREVEEKEAEDKKRRVVREEKRMTGKEMWERGLAGKGEEESDEDGEDAVEGMKGLKVES